MIGKLIELKTSIEENNVENVQTNVWYLSSLTKQLRLKVYVAKNNGNIWNRFI